jgi:antitoxin MazE
VAPGIHPLRKDSFCRDNIIRRVATLELFKCSGPIHIWTCRTAQKELSHIQEAFLNAPPSDWIFFPSDYMKTIELKVSRIGNFKGIRIPASVLRKYGISDKLLMEQRPNEIALRTHKRKKMSWKQTFEAMAREKEDWSNFNLTSADGLD